MREWLGRIGVKTLFIEPGSPWENGYCQSFNSKHRDELLAGEQFSTLHEAKVLLEQWRRHYNAVRPTSSRSFSLRISVDVPSQMANVGHHRSVVGLYPDFVLAPGMLL